MNCTSHLTHECATSSYWTIRWRTGPAHKRGDNDVTKFFTQGSHHRNLTVVYIVQNLFNQDRSMRTISLNTHYMVLFKNPRDATQIRTLSLQMYPDNPRMLVNAYRDATSQPYGYLLLNLRPDACDALRILTDVFAREPTVYVPPEHDKQGDAAGIKAPSATSLFQFFS